MSTDNKTANAWEIDQQEPRRKRESAAPAEDEASLGFLIADVTRLIRQEFSRRLEGSPLTLAQARVLVHLAREEGINQKELAQRLELKPITLVRQIDLLEAEGVVKRCPDPEDRRAYRLYLTDQANIHLEAIEQATSALRDHVLSNVGEDELAITLQTLNKMRTTLLGGA